MKKIDITINQARLKSFEVDFSDEEETPKISATIALLAGGKQISTFTIGTRGWDDKELNVPAKIHKSVREIGDELENILIQECSNSLGLLKSGDFS